MGETLQVMSFNVRHDTAERTAPGDPDHWLDREPLVVELLTRDRPALLGTQEPEFHQLPALRSGLGPSYDVVGFGREGGSAGEYSAILYDTERLRLEAWDQRWLSDTPRLVASATWGNEIPRILVWARFRDRSTGAVFLHVNSHFDHRCEEARERSAVAVRDLIAEAGLPAVVTVDANAPAEDSTPYQILTSAAESGAGGPDGGLRDAWLVADDRLTPDVGTFHGYGEPVPEGRRIDWILTTPDIGVESAAIDAWTKQGRWPSDHVPVRARLRLPVP